MNFFLLCRLGWIKWRGRALGIARDAPQGDEPSGIVWAIPVAGPLPDIANHVVEAVTVRWILRYRRDTEETVFP
jgi:hypothetical protein